MTLKRTHEVILPPAADRYITFCRFCSNCRVSAREIAEVIQLADKCRKAKKFDAKQSLAIEIIVRLRECGFRDVQVLNEKQEVDIKMSHPVYKGNMLRLPIDKF